jgi:hypothetical protein
MPSTGLQGLRAVGLHGLECSVLQFAGMMPVPVRQAREAVSDGGRCMWDQEFESGFLQRPVRCEPVSRRNSPSYVEKPRFSAGVRAGASGAIGRDAQGARQYRAYGR